MKDAFYITRKYWRKHKRTLIALLFAGIVMMTVVVSSFLQIRSEFNRTLHSNYDSDGMYDVMLVDVSDTFYDNLINKKTPSKIESIKVFGNAEIYGCNYVLGSADCDLELAHIPFEEGTMPKDEKEVAISRGVLENVGFNGVVGDTITINNKNYLLSGIIDKTYDQRFGSQLNNASLGGEISPKPIPLIYLVDNTSDIKYQITLFDGVVSGSENDESVFGMPISDFLNMTSEEFGEDARWYVSINNKNYMAFNLAENSKEFKDNVRWLILLCVIASTIAVLSVFSVLRIIFAERAHTDELLHRVGMSNRKIKSMYALECILFTVIQGLIGSALGIAGYKLIHDYRIRQLGYRDLSAFTSDLLVTANTYNPFILGIAFTAIIMALGYITASLFRGKSIKHLGFGHGIGKALSNGSITAIQIVSLTLIMTGSMLGYMYYTSDGKQYMNQLSYEPAPGYELCDTLDMEKDNIEEYYSCGSPMVLTPYAVIDDMEYNGVPMTQSDYSFGLNDDSISMLGNIRACAEMTGTFLVSDKQNEMLNGQQITTDKMEINDDLIASSETEYKNFFEKGQTGSKYLYRINTRLVNESVLNELNEYVETGEINVDAIMQGKEILVVSNSNGTLFNAGDKITIGSLIYNDENGIKGESSSEVTIGAVVVIRYSDFNVNNLLRYTATSKYGICLLTTQTGAQSLGLFGAAYTEVFSDHHIDGGLIPPSTGMTLTSLEGIKTKRDIEKATSMGGAVLIIVLMSVLGFAAYFNGIGLKIKLKEYQISVLRAIGTSKAKIRARLFLSNLKIPVIAAAISGAGAYAIQKFFASQYDKMVALAHPDEYGVISYDDATIIKQQEMIDKYFLNSEMWLPSINKPLVIVLLTVTIITILLTVISLRSLKSNISDMMAKGRKRQ